jgi:hypothetical protein
MSKSLFSSLGQLIGNPDAIMLDRAILKKLVKKVLPMTF